MNSVPAIRIRRANNRPVNPRGGYVLYWMVANRRLTWNYSLQRAVEWALELSRPLVILEALRMGYPWASDRFHRFILDGMAQNVGRAQKYPVVYYPYVEPSRDKDKGQLFALGESSCVIVTDDFPAFFLPAMISTAARKVKVSMELVDSNGLLPMGAAERVYTTAYAFRRYMQKTLPRYLEESPRPDPLRGAPLKRLRGLPEEITQRWPATTGDILQGKTEVLSTLPIDHRVGACSLRGGPEKAKAVLMRFIRKRLSLYMENRNHPDLEGTSGLSPYLHFGHISVHQIFDQIKKIEQWAPDHLSEKVTGGKSGWWGMVEPAEAFLDELVTWRELGFNMCRQRTDYDHYDSLPPWALTTLKRHEKDRRPYLYSLDEFETARTHDPLWNAAQNQLLREGKIHNVLRMLWGKKILEWTRTPGEALEVLIELNNKYALDGRDPNSYSGISWILGRYDRPWGPERTVFGKVRYMSSENTVRKWRVSEYVRKYAPAE
jgi:deoxyribodipyrimidine photo-lyase